MPAKTGAASRAAIVPWGASESPDHLAVETAANFRLVRRPTRKFRVTWIQNILADHRELHVLTRIKSQANIHRHITGAGRIWLWAGVADIQVEFRGMRQRQQRTHRAAMTR